MSDPITLPREVVQNALDALQFAAEHKVGGTCLYNLMAIPLLSALAEHPEPTKQEPVESDDDEEFTREDVTTLLLEVMDWTYAQAHRNRPMTEAEQKVLDDIRTALAAEQPKHPGYVIGSHWLETAYSRICAGEAEADVLRDCGWERVDDAEALRRDAERYRWLRDWERGTHDIVPMTGRYCDTPILSEKLDAAIDAAMEDK